MKAEELRIGNLVNIIGLVSTEITAKHIVFIYEGDDQYEPILLTNEWLEKLGFKKDYDNCPTLIIDKNRFQWSRNILTWQQNPHNDWSSFNCEYVHQLQNLYFVLVGMDLAVAPPCP